MLRIWRKQAAKGLKGFHQDMRKYCLTMPVLYWDDTVKRSLRREYMERLAAFKLMLLDIQMILEKYQEYGLID